MILECTRCEALVNAEPVESYDYKDELGFNNTYSFLRCPKCISPFLVNEDALLGVSTLYPPQDNRVNPNLPGPLKAAYKEALSCFKSKAFTATAIMCRKTLEGICVEHGAKAQN